MKTISVVIPCFNEEENVVPISEAVIEIFNKELPDYDYEIIFIDNDSQDKTRELLRELCGKNPKIKAIFNAKNFGQFKSPYYGLLQVTGDCGILVAADFQDPVEMIPKFVKEILVQFNTHIVPHTLIVRDFSTHSHQRTGHSDKNLLL